MKRQYDHLAIEKKWKERWEKLHLYEVDPAKAEDPFYCLDMFPYPSGDGLHVGHWRGYVLSDFYARYWRLMGKNVLHPMGFDAFGLPAENAAIKYKSHPKKFTEQAIKTFLRQLSDIGAAYDYTKTISTSDPEYYHWTQWLFLQLFKHGLAEKRKSLVNWCPKDQTVLANEQVVNGCCDRCGTRVTKKELEQWYFKTTAFADELIEGLEKVNWPEHVKSLQRNWIGKSEGAEISFSVSFDEENKPNFVILHGYTGRADKNFIPWLKKELESRGFKVQAPQLPNTDNPTEAEQVEYVIKNCQIDKNTVLVGHSLGGVVAMKTLQKVNKPIAGIVLVAPAMGPRHREGGPRPFWKTFTWDYDYQKIKKLTGFQLIISDSQETERIAYLKHLSEELSAPFVETVAAKDHFTATVEPFILKQLLPSITVFTTRPDTIYGVTALVLAPEHPLAGSLVSGDKTKEFEAYKALVASKTNIDRQQGKESEKTAFFTGSYALHPLTNEKIPIWLADYVLMEYGTGAVMSVPAHDERDFMFAKTHDLPIKQVIAPNLIQSTEPAKYRPGEPIKRGESVIVFIKHPKENKYLGLDWKESSWGAKTLLTGTIDDLTPEETLTKEIKEETGFQKFHIVEKLGVIDGLFYHLPKKTNKLVRGHVFLVQLEDEKRTTIEDHEAARHEMKWLTAQELRGFLTPASHQLALGWLDHGYQPYTELGALMNSGEFDYLTSEKAAEKVITLLEKKGLGKKATTYRLRDWLVSRQRYWGAPIPVVYDPEDKAHPVKDEHLPLSLPTDVDFLPGGESPIARSQEYRERAEKLYGKGWHFDTDTLDTFVDSSWYFLRYLSPHDDSEPFRPELVKKWLPIDIYIGGIEHATLHLLYCRFVVKFLAKFGYIDHHIDEPIKMLYNIGMINLNGTKMSKSKGNVISPDTLIEHYGTDALRGYELFIGPLDVEAEWNPRGINGIHRFLIKLNGLLDKVVPTSKEVDEQEFQRYLAAIEPMIADFHLNTIVAEAMKLVNIWERHDEISAATLKKFIITLSPIFPFIAEEMWEVLGEKESIFLTRWPEKATVTSTNEITVMVNQKFVGRLAPNSETEEGITEEAKKLASVAERLGNKKIEQVVYRAGKMINFIVKS